VSRRTKVAHVVVAGDIGGAERLLIDLASRPEASCAEHCVALMTPNPKLRAKLQAAGLHIRDRGPVRADPISYLWRAFGPVDVDWLQGVLREEAANIVHVHTYASHLIGVRAALRSGLPVVRTEHGVAHYDDPSCALGRAWALRNTDALVAVSEYVGRFVASRAAFARDRIRVIRNGVDEAYFAPSPPPRASTGGAFRFAIVCRLEAWKRVDHAIRAVAKVPGTRLTIAGSGAEERGLRCLPRRLGIADRVEFLGWQADPRPAIAGCHAAVNCSRNEPLGLSVLEAMSMQRPVLAVDAGGVPEIVRHGETGWLVPDGSADALALGFAEASADQAKAAAFGAAARRFIEQEAGIELMCRGYADAYADVLDRHAAHRGAGERTSWRRRKPGA
jgi:glycosyltransferase involved in cell wall biosynthesis